MLFTTRGTQVIGAKLMLLEAQGQERLIFEDDRKDVDGDFFTNPIQALAMDPEGRTVMFITMDKASNFALRKSVGFGFGGVSVSVTMGGYLKRALRGIYLWQKDTGTCQRLWDEKGLEAASDAWKKSPEGKAFKDTVKFHQVITQGGPLTMHHLKGDRFLLAAGGCLFEIRSSKPSIRPLLATESEPVWASWRTPDGHLWCLALKAQRELAPATISQKGKVISNPGITLLPLFEMHQVYEVDQEGTVTPRGLLQGSLDGTLNAGSTVFASTEMYRRAYTLEGSITEGLAIGIKEDDGFKLIHTSVDGSGYFLLDDRTFGDDTLIRRGADHQERWRINLGSTQGKPQIVESGDTIGILCLQSSSKLRRFLLNRTSGAVLSDGPWDLHSGGTAGRALTAGLAQRMVSIPTPQGCLVWLPANGGKLHKDFEQVAWLLPATHPKDLQPGPETGTWYRLDSDLILRPLGGRPLADQVVLILGGQTYAVGHPLHAGIRTGDNRRSSVTTREEGQDPFYQDGRDAALTFLGSDIVGHPAPALRQWAESILVSHPILP